MKFRKLIGPMKMISVIIVLFFWVGCEESSKKSPPVIVKITPYTAIISWNSEKKEIGELEYLTEGEKLQTASEFSADTKHVIQITGLLPQTIYQYGFPGSKEKFSFKTGPKKESAFRFAIIGDVNISMKSIEDQYPDFLIFAPKNKLDSVKLNLTKLNSRIPIHRDSFRFVWGEGLFLSENNGLLRQDQNSFVFQFSQKQLFRIPDSNQFFINVIYQNQDSLIQYKKNGLQLYSGNQNIVVEVQGTGIRAGLFEEGLTGALSLELKKSSYAYKKTCVYCRNLLETKQYIKSIEGYRSFMESQNDSAYQEDALYQIAFIYDHYLFQYPEAIENYESLVQTYPNSRNSRMANFRLQYIADHSGNNFEPLKIYEKAKLNDLREDSLETMQKVENVLLEYPQTTLKQEILMWLGKVFSDIDKAKALKYLNQLNTETQDHKIKWKSGLAIGDLYYEHMDFKQSEKYYKNLLIQFPENEFTLKNKINRSTRNFWRDKIQVGAIVFCLAVFLFVVSIKPRGLKLTQWKKMLIYFSGLIILTGIPFYLYFEYLEPAIPFAISLIGSILFGFYITGEFSRKTANWFSNTLTLSISSASIYILWILCLLYIWSNTFHLLFIFERIIF